LVGAVCKTDNSTHKALDFYTVFHDI